MDIVLYGTNGETLELKRVDERGTKIINKVFEGIIPNLERRFRETKVHG